MGARESANDALVQELGLQDCVALRDYVPHREAIAAMRGADVLVLIKHVEPRFQGLIPGKLYEYMGAGRPILALVPASEAADLVRDGGWGEVAPPDDAEAIAAALLRLAAAPARRNPAHRRIRAAAGRSSSGPRRLASWRSVSTRSSTALQLPRCAGRRHRWARERSPMSDTGPARDPRAGNALAAGTAGTPGWERRAALLLFALGVLAFRTAIMDDTFIHLQYARNLRHAGELAFNPGEPSLGATSPLWVLFLAATGAGETGARLLSLACGAFSMLVLRLAGPPRTLGHGAWARAATLAWAGNVWLVRHAPNGMETMAAVLLVLVAVELRSRGGRHVGRDVGTGLALAGAVLARPEVLLLAGVFLVQDLCQRLGPRPARRLGCPPSCCPALRGPGFAHAQTGHFLPATGAAKSGGVGLAPLAWLLRPAPRGQHAGGRLTWWMAAAWRLAAGLCLRLEGRAALRRGWQHPLAPVRTRSRSGSPAHTRSPTCRCSRAIS